MMWYSVIESTKLNNSTFTVISALLTELPKSAKACAGTTR